MYIIVGQKRASILKETHLILSLEKIYHENIEDRAYCVIPFDKVNLTDLPMIENIKDLHERFVEEYENKNYQYCRDVSEHLYGKFGGELDTFYDEILKRIS